MSGASFWDRTTCLPKSDLDGRRSRRLRLSLYLPQLIKTVEAIYEQDAVDVIDLVLEYLGQPAGSLYSLIFAATVLASYYYVVRATHIGYIAGYGKATFFGKCSPEDLTISGL